MATSEKESSLSKSSRLAARVDRLMYKFARNWLTVFNTAVAIYVFLPILAPVLMNAGITRPAQAIYTIYSPMCHQMASRSFFLFGEQIAYPRALAGTDLTPLEAYTNDIDAFEGVDEDNWANFFLAARRFVGNEQLGYKMALCERDIAIYGFVLIGGLVYGLLRRRYHIKPLPIWLFILIGMGPIALDGFSQLFSYYATPLDGSQAEGIRALVLQIFPLRESTPFLRTFTGALFGFMLVWLAYPHINEGMKASERDLAQKFETHSAE